MVARWYVAQCLPRCEGWAIKNASAQEFPTFWPRYETPNKHGALRQYYRGVFPGYIFVNFDTDDYSWRRICSTFGVRRILGATDAGAPPLPHGWVETMIESAPTGVIELPKETAAQFKAGDPLKITEGPLAGRIGVFQYSEKGRVSLLLSLLSRQTSVIIPLDKVSYAGAVL
jgi:transcriptional antiterminator RfaH